MTLDSLHEIMGEYASMAVRRTLVEIANDDPDLDDSARDILVAYSNNCEIICEGGEESSETFSDNIVDFPTTKH